MVAPFYELIKLPFNRLRETNLRLKFVTNTTKESKRQLLNRLNGLGFEIGSSEIFSSLSAARKLIEDMHQRPMLMLDERAVEDFEGLPTDDPNCVLVGLAPDKFDYATMNAAFRLLEEGASLIAIHKGRYYRRSDGLALGPGPFVTALEYATDKTATVVGKPQSQFFLQALDELGVCPEEAVMIGDDVLDDVAGAMSAGLFGILVKTGKYRAGDEDKVNPKPNLLVDNFECAVDHLLKNSSIDH
ncbi:HDHD2 (predicted) [Pycnogonum litorale]